MGSKPTLRLYGVDGPWSEFAGLLSTVRKLKKMQLKGFTKKYSVVRLIRVDSKPTQEHYSVAGQYSKFVGRLLTAPKLVLVGKSVAISHRRSLDKLTLCWTAYVTL